MSFFVLQSFITELMIEFAFDYGFKRGEELRLPCSHCGNQCCSLMSSRGDNMQDIYGNRIDNSDGNSCILECGICLKQVSAIRFAPHLEKCMGIGGRLAGGRGGSTGITGTRSFKPSKQITPTPFNLKQSPQKMLEKKHSPVKKHKKNSDLTPNGSVSLLNFVEEGLN